MPSLTKKLLNYLNYFFFTAILYPKLCSALEFLTQFVFTTETLMERSADESSAEQKDSPKTDKIPSSIEKLRMYNFVVVRIAVHYACLLSLFLY